MTKSFFDDRKAVDFLCGRSFTNDYLAAPYSGELVQRTTITLPAMPDPAGKGVVRVPVERNQMTTQKRTTKELSQKEAWYRAASIVFYYGDQIGIARPKAIRQQGRKIWISAIGIWKTKTSWVKLGEIAVDANTSKIIRRTKRRDMLARLRAITPT